MSYLVFSSLAQNLPRVRLAKILRLLFKISKLNCQLICYYLDFLITYRPKLRIRSIHFLLVLHCSPEALIIQESISESLTYYLQLGITILLIKVMLVQKFCFEIKLLIHLD